MARTNNAIALATLVWSAWSLPAASSFVANQAVVGRGGCGTPACASFAAKTLLSTSVVSMESSSSSTTTAVLDADVAADAEIGAGQRRRQEQQEQRPMPIRQRGMFHSEVYDKPIVLLGCSGGNDELSRLANSLSKPTINGGSTVGSPIITISTPSDLSSIQAKIDRGELDRSHVIVVDFAASSSETTAYLTEAARSLYADSGLLSVYINVHPSKSQMSEDDALLRSQLESAVFLSNTDFELIVTDEGCNTPENIKMNPWEDIEWDLRRLLARATLPPATPGDQDVLAPNTAEVTMGKHTYFLSLSFPQIESVEPYLPAMCADVDAMEFRADLLECCEDRFELLRSLQWLRRGCRQHAVRAPGLASVDGSVIDDVLPIVYTVRTAHQAGTWPDDANGIKRMFDLLELGLRSGVEVMDVESAWDPIMTDKILTLAEERHATLILGSHHKVPEEVSMEEAIGYFRQCHLSGRSHGAKVVLSIENEDNDSMADDAGKIAQSLCRAEGEPIVPNISLILSEIGQFSRIINERFTPVTHESLPFAAAPGQLSAKQIMEDKLRFDLLETRKFAILGHNIAYSVSPQMHNAAFKATQLPHEYGRADYETVEEFIAGDEWNDACFGGCSVTIPHKQSIMPFLDRLEPAAKDIGAVNTVFVRQEKDFDGSMRRVMIGDNTDWRGIYNPLNRRGCASSNSSGGEGPGAALILGAGGTARAAAYAATKLGLELIYWNRTPDRLTGIVDEFGGMVVSDLSEDSLGVFLKDTNTKIKAVISTLPAASEFELPQWIIEQHTAPESTTKPVVFDVNYKPYTTKLLHQAQKANLAVVRGSEMLWEQGVGQFQLWTGRTAPYKVMKDVVLENCQ